MTPQELRTAIEADAICIEHVNAGNDAACATRLTEILPRKIVGHFLTTRGVLDAFSNPADGEQVMQVLEQVAISNAVVRRALTWMEPANGGVDVGATSTRSMLDSLVAGGALTLTQANTLKSLAETPHVVTHEAVARAFGRGI